MRWRCWPRTFTHSLAGAAGFNRLSDSALLGFGIDPASLHDVGSGFGLGFTATTSSMCWRSPAPTTGAIG